MFVETAHLWPTLEAARTRAEGLVVAMIVSTSGSTYKKAGSMMLIDAHGKPQGLLSGGCLEDDLAAHARSVAKSSECKRIRYDLNDDSPFGLGMGCRGTVDILMFPVTQSDGYEPLETLARADASGASATLTIGVNPQHADEFGQHEVRVHGETKTPQQNAGRWRQDALSIEFQPRPTLLVIGAGSDTQPIYSFAHALQWNVDGYDHRAGLLTQTNFPTARALYAGRPQEIHHALRLEQYDAAVLMSHNLEHDAAYLKQLAPCSLRYVGILGPRSRRDEVLEKAALTADDFDGNLFGPAGIDMGGRQTESIALSILAQIHKRLHQQGRIR